MMASCTCDRADCYNCVFERGYQLGLNAYILDTDRSHPMTTNTKPLLTRKQVREYRADTTDVGCNNTEMITPEEKLAMLDTIDRMAELLTERCEDLVGFEEWCGTHDKFCEPCQRKHDLLSTFNATGGEGS